MKDTLEYKILKYLSENDNGEFININLLSEDKVLLNKSILDLKNKRLINAKKYTSNGYDKYFLCQINFEGKIFFNAIKPEQNKKSHNNSDFLNNQSTDNLKLLTNSEEVTKSKLKSLFSNSWFIGISLVVLAAIFSGKRVMNFINNILDGL
ncbi:hypothetical protein SAMN05444372_101229 [Flavobacterium micromati]|uniref:Uncharacterized protein n=1 Tax=Flavobacterium micromati TaxID=229205 RepID=A0A1M5FP63_9FLAO|nr:hypothetical protein [Flavobacterium micromati]SHF93347.1 hypothetical protein SAMN05444372_101229 [Flavobacterium micromati]